MPRRTTSIIDSIAYIGFLTFRSTVRAAPMQLSVSILCFLFKRIKYRNHTITSNLTNSFPDQSEEELSQIKNKFYTHLANALIGQLRGEDIHRIRYKNVSALNSMIEQKGVVLLLASHYGCWETLGRQLSPLLDKDIVQYGVYKGIHNPHIDRAIQKSRTTDRITPLEMQQVYRSVLDAKKEGKKAVYYLIMDQYPSALQNLITINFLNQKTWFINGAEKMATKLNLTVYYLNLTIEHKESTAEIIPLNKKEETITIQYAHLLEKQIRNDPAYWLWSHRRWKNLR